MERSVTSQFDIGIKYTPSKDSTFIIAGNNGNWIIEQTLQDLGWKRVMDRNAENFKLKWVEIKASINYDTFKEGEQMVNRIPNCYMLTNKLGLLTSLRRFERISQLLYVTGVIKLKSSDFLPETYRLDESHDRKIFVDTFRAGDIWICKPIGLNQGRGIYLVRDIDDLKLQQPDNEDKQRNTDNRTIVSNFDRIVQRYIMNPLLLEGKKFDIRVFMLIANTSPFLVLYHKGYARLSLHMFSSNSDDLTIHLTNQFIQKKDPQYEYCKNDTVWNFEKLNNYINKKIAPHKGIEVDWVYNTLTNQMKQIMLYCFHSVKHKLNVKIGYFDLYGFDFLVDDNMKVWLLEVNANPCLATNCAPLREIIPQVIQESLHLAIECFEKARRNFPILPLKNCKNFEVLSNGTLNGDAIRLRSGKNVRSSSPVAAQPKPDKPTSNSQNGSVSFVFGKEYVDDASCSQLVNENQRPSSMFDVNTEQTAKNQFEMQLQNFLSHRLRTPTYVDSEVDATLTPFRAEGNYFSKSKSASQSRVIDANEADKTHATSAVGLDVTSPSNDKPEASKKEIIVVAKSNVESASKPEVMLTTMVEMDLKKEDTKEEDVQISGKSSILANSKSPSLVSSKQMAGSESKKFETVSNSSKIKANVNKNRNDGTPLGSSDNSTIHFSNTSAAYDNMEDAELTASSSTLQNKEIKNSTSTEELLNKLDKTEQTLKEMSKLLRKSPFKNEIPNRKNKPVESINKISNYKLYDPTKKLLTKRGVISNGSAIATGEDPPTKEASRSKIIPDSIASQIRNESSKSPARRHLTYSAETRGRIMARERIKMLQTPKYFLSYKPSTNFSQSNGGYFNDMPSSSNMSLHKFKRPNQIQDDKWNGQGVVTSSRFDQSFRSKRFDKPLGTALKPRGREKSEKDGKLLELNSWLTGLASLRARISHPMQTKKALAKDQFQAYPLTASITKKIKQSDKDWGHFTVTNGSG